MIRVLRQAALVILSGFFLFAGASKLLDPATFSHDIAAYRMMPPLFSWIFALWIPWIEVFAALALWWQGLRRAGVLVLGGLLLVFQVALIGAALRGLDISCGCLGSAFDTGILFAFLRNLVLLGLIAALPGLKGSPS